MNRKMLSLAIAFVLGIGGTIFVAGAPYQTASAQEGMTTQTGVLIGYGGQMFGVATVDTNGHVTRVNAVSDLVPNPDMVFEGWLVDGNYAASGYPLSLGQFIKDGTLSYNENLVNSKTYTDLVITMEPKDDPDPKPAWANTVAAYYLAPPFGK